MVKEIEIKIPTSYGDISLKKWLDLQKDINNYKDNDEAIGAVMIYHLCGLDASYLKSLPVDTYNTIRDELNNFLGNVDLPLKRFVTIDGIEYGFEPNLSNMTYGAYSDITLSKKRDSSTKLFIGSQNKISNKINFLGDPSRLEIPTF